MCLYELIRLPRLLTCPYRDRMTLPLSALTAWSPVIVSASASIASKSIKVSIDVILDLLGLLLGKIKLLRKVFALGGHTEEPFDVFLVRKGMNSFSLN